MRNSTEEGEELEAEDEDEEVREKANLSGDRVATPWTWRWDQDSTEEMLDSVVPDLREERMQDSMEQTRQCLVERELQDSTEQEDEDEGEGEEKEEKEENESGAVAVTEGAVRRMMRNLVCDRPVVRVLSHEGQEAVIADSLSSVPVHLSSAVAASLHSGMALRILEWARVRRNGAELLVILQSQPVSLTLSSPPKEIQPFNETEDRTAIPRTKRVRVEEEQFAKTQRMMLGKSKVWVAMEESGEMKRDDKNRVLFRYRLDGPVRSAEPDNITPVSPSRSLQSLKKKTKLKPDDNEADSERGGEVAELMSSTGLSLQELASKLEEATGCHRSVAHHALYVTNCIASAAFDYLTLALDHVDSPREWTLAQDAVICREYENFLSMKTHPLLEHRSTDDLMARLLFLSPGSKKNK